MAFKTRGEYAVKSSWELGDEMLDLRSHTLYPAITVRPQTLVHESTWMTQDTVPWHSKRKRAAPENPCEPKGRIQDTPQVKIQKIKIQECSKEIKKHQKIPIGKQLMDVDINRPSGGC